MNMKFVIFNAFLFLSSHLCFAENLTFENVRVGGIGCPGEKTQIVLAPDGSAASLIFDNYESKVPKISTGSIKDSPFISDIACNVFLEVKIPLGQKLESLDLTYDMRGNAYFDIGTQGNFKSFMMKSSGLGTEQRYNKGPVLLQEKNWINSQAEQFEDFSIKTTKSIPFSSNCRGNSGKEDRVIIHLQHHVFSKINSGFENSSAVGAITMDSSDITGGIKLKATTSECRIGGGRPIPPRSCEVGRGNVRGNPICK